MNLGGRPAWRGRKKMAFSFFKELPELRELWPASVARNLERLVAANVDRMTHYVISCGDENLSQARLAHELVISLHISDPLRAADIERRVDVVVRRAARLMEPLVPLDERMPGSATAQLQQQIADPQTVLPLISPLSCYPTVPFCRRVLDFIVLLTRTRS